MLEINNVEIKFGIGERLLIENLTLESGSFVQVCSQNRSGKSIFLDTINGDYSHFSGDILINKTSHRKSNSKILIKREPVFIEDRSVWKNLLLPLKKLSRDKKRRIDEFCEFAQIKHLFPKKSSHISYSEKKMIEIIRAVIQYPFLLMIDDLDNFFDAEQYKIAHHFLVFAAQAGTTVLATCSSRLADFDYFTIEKGRLVQK